MVGPRPLPGLQHHQGAPDLAGSERRAGSSQHRGKVSAFPVRLEREVCKVDDWGFALHGGLPLRLVEFGPWSSHPSGAFVWLFTPRARRRQSTRRDPLEPLGRYRMARAQSVGASSMMTKSSANSSARITRRSVANSSAVASRERFVFPDSRVCRCRLPRFVVVEVRPVPSPPLACGRTVWWRPVRGAPSAHARVVSNRASSRLQARSACASLYTAESGGHQPCRVPA